jgi:DNA (cytosine-5)-methyltransferase 1
MGFDKVLADLATVGYDAQWQIVSAASVGAPHRRDRIIIVAYPQSNWQRRGHFDSSGAIQERAEIQIEARGGSSTMAHNDGQWHGFDWSQGFTGQTHLFWGHNARRKATNVSRQWWASEPDVGRVANGVPSRVDRLRGLGNAVVPQVAEIVGQMVIDYDTNN